MKRSKGLLIILVSLIAIVLVGCGSGSNVEMKEFMLYGDMVSISMDESWVIEDLGMGYNVGAFTEDGKEGIFVNQYEKMYYANSIYSMDTLKERVEDSFGICDLEKTDNPNISSVQNVETYSCVIPSNGVKGDGMILYFETDYAYYSIIYAALRMNTEKREYFRNVCATFKESEPKTLVQTTDTILWFNATCAILTELNGWNYTIFGGVSYYANSKFSMQYNLNRLWNVIDRATADETIDWLISEGNHVSFVADMQSIEESGIENISEGERVNFILENFEVDEEEAQRYVNRYEAYKQYGDDTITAWDYSRAMWLYASYYLAGYYTLEEALDASLAMAEDIQNSFDSWDSFMDSYFMGYEYWGEESSDERRAVYEEIKAASDSPFNVDWNLEFEKTW